MPDTIRLATPGDAAQIAAIYAPFVEKTHVSFERTPPTAAEMGARIHDTTKRYPWLVCERDRQIRGYVYAHRYRERDAYQWTVEVSAYMHPDSRGQGLGKVLYGVLFELLRMQGFIKVIAGIALPNPASEGLHKSVGFSLVGVYHAVGYKAGVWRDVARWELSLREALQDPPAPLPLEVFLCSTAWREAVARGERMLNGEGDM